jgi:1-phosphofructokinase family hexose kinase
MNFLCVSPNPAIDKRISLRELSPGHIHRVSDVRACPGGKAAHVAMVLRTLGETPSWIGFTGGEPGQDLISGLCSLGIRANACTTQGRTRVNLEILEEGGRVTEILEPGGAPTAQEAAGFQRSCHSAFMQGGDQLTVIFSGSLPPGVAGDFYGSLIESANSYGCTTFLDTSGDALRPAIAAGPGFVKPNRQEAEQLLGMKITDISDGVAAVKRLLSLGARSAAISLGEQGLLWYSGHEAEVYYAKAIDVRPRSTVGSGDATVAAFAYAAGRAMAAKESLALATACGAANCLADSPGAARLADIERFRERVRAEILAVPW